MVESLYHISGTTVYLLNRKDHTSVNIYVMYSCLHIPLCVFLMLYHG